MRSSKTIKTLNLLIAVVLIVQVFQWGGSAAYAAETKNNTSKTTAISTEKDAIAVYGTYKGKNAKRIPIITYHKVVTDKTKRKSYCRNSSLVISKSNFTKQMKWLKNNGYRTINCDEFYLWYKGKIKLPKKSVLITFDDGEANVVQNAYPVLKKFGMKGTVFIIGRRTWTNKKGFISYKTMKKIQETYPDFEFQSHTWNLHKHYSSKGAYAKVLRDAKVQKKRYGFDYVAYPYGRYTKGIIKAYRKNGIKLAFTYGTNNYATRKQNIYKIERIKIYGNGSMNSFKRWFR